MYVEEKLAWLFFAGKEGEFSFRVPSFCVAAKSSKIQGTRHEELPRRCIRCTGADCGRVESLASVQKKEDIVPSNFAYSS